MSPTAKPQLTFLSVSFQILKMSFTATNAHCLEFHFCFNAGLKE